MIGVEIYVGALAPEAYALVLTSASVDGVDLETVTAAKLVVKSPSGAETEWTVTRDYDAVAETLTLKHTFDATTSEINREGMWSVYALLTIPTGFVRSLPRPIFARGRFHITPER